MRFEQIFTILPHRKRRKLRQDDDGESPHRTAEGASGPRRFACSPASSTLLLVEDDKELAGSDGRPLRTNERIPLRGLVNDVVEANYLNALQKRCRVVEQFTNSAVVTGDRALLTRVLDNVLRNAIQYSPVDGHIDVEVRHERGEAVLAVRDYGSAVPDSMLASIFEAFFRVDESRESSTGGVGLGLAIVKRTVLLHGGSVTANNAEPGLLVTIRLPIAASNDDALSDRVA